MPATRHRKNRVAVAEGFSLHADTLVHANDREGLERLCRYGARGPIAQCRLRRLADDRYEYTPKRGQTFTLTTKASKKKSKHRPRGDWATLHQHTFGTDVFRWRRFAASSRAWRRPRSACPSTPE